MLPVMRISNKSPYLIAPFIVLLCVTVLIAPKINLAEESTQDALESLFKGKSELTYLSEGFKQVSPPLWSPDGEIILFEAFNKGSYRDLYWADYIDLKPNQLTYERQCDPVKIQKELFGIQYGFTSDPQIFLFAATHELNTDLFVFNKRENIFRQLTYDRSWDGDAAWSADGKNLVFVSTRMGNADLWIKKISKWRISSPRQLTYHKELDFSPAWSADGKLIAFTSFRGKNFDIYTIQPDGKKLKRLTALDTAEKYPAWFPDNQHIAFYSENKLCSVDTTGVFFKVLAENVRIDPRGPSISPDGNLIAYVPLENPQQIIRILKVNDLYTYDLKIDGLNVGDQIEQVRFSPKGRLLSVYITSESGSKIYIIKTSGKFSKPSINYRILHLPPGETLSWRDVLELVSEPESGEAGDSGESGISSTDF